MSTLSIAEKILREAVSARLAEIRAGKVAAYRRALARVEQERDSWQELALAAQRRCTDLEKQLAAIYVEARMD